MLLVEGDRLLDGGVADGVPVGQVLCDDARARLVFLGDVVSVLVLEVAGGACAGGAAGDVVEGLGRLDVDC